MTTIAPELNLPPDHPLRQILDTIAAHPEVREPVLRVLLTEDLLALPEQVRELRADFTEFKEETREQFRTVNERWTRTPADWTRTPADWTRTSTSPEAFAAP